MQRVVIDRMERAKKIVLNDLSDKHTIKSLAEAVYLSESTLTHGFRDYYNTSVHDFIINSRLSKAKSLIESDPHLNISEVAYEVGFKCPSRFSVAFSERFGVLPSRYRDSRRQVN